MELFQNHLSEFFEEGFEPIQKKKNVSKYK